MLIHSFIIHPSLNSSILRVFRNSERKTITKIEILLPDGTVQVFDDRIADDYSWHPQYLCVEDVNFDGFRDLRLMEDAGATGNNSYTFWLFDPFHRKFVLNDEFSMLASPRFNPKTKEVVSHEKGGMGGRIYITRTYRIRRGRLILVKEEKQDFIESERQFMRTVTIWRNGRFIVVKRYRIPLDS